MGVSKGMAKLSGLIKYVFDHLYNQPRISKGRSWTLHKHSQLSIHVWSHNVHLLLPCSLISTLEHLFVILATWNFEVGVVSLTSASQAGHCF